MSNVFEITDKSGRRIRLTDKQWEHIVKTHGEMTNYLGEIKETLILPMKTIKHSVNDLRKYFSFHKNRKHPEKYLRVIIKYLNGDGFVITAHFVRNLN